MQCMHVQLFNNCVLFRVAPHTRMTIGYMYVDINYRDRYILLLRLSAYLVTSFFHSDKFLNVFLINYLLNWFIKDVFSNSCPDIRRGENVMFNLEIKQQAIARPNFCKDPFFRECHINYNEWVAVLIKYLTCFFKKSLLYFK